MSKWPPTSLLEPLLPGVARLVAQNRSLTDDAAGVLLIAADISPDADLVKELKLWAAILQRGLATGGSGANIVITEAFRLRGLGEERIEEAVQLLETEVSPQAASRGGEPDKTTQETIATAPDPYIESLVVQLEDEDEDVRREAAEELSRLGDVRAVKVLVETCDMEDDTGERRIEATVLPLIERIGESAIPALADVLQDPEVEETARFVAALSLGTLGDGRGISSMVDYLSTWTEDGLWPARNTTIAVLGRFGGERVFELLLGLWPWEGAQEEVEAALHNLGLFNAETFAAFLLDGDKWEWPRQTAAHLLAQSGGQRAVGPLIAALSDKEGTVVWSSIRALSDIGDPRAIGPIIEHLDQSHTGVGADRHVLPESLAKFGADAVEPFIRALQDQQSDSRHLLIQALGLIGDPRAVGPLVDLMLSDKD